MNSIRTACVGLALFFCMAVGARPAAVRILYQGQCIVTGGVATRWDVYQEIFQTGSPTWLPAHTHHGAECILTVQGVTSWWFHGSGITQVNVNQSLYTAQGRIHTAGNASGATMAYMGIHVLEAGSQFRYDVADPQAPPQSSTGATSIFFSKFPNQASSPGTFTIANRVEAIDANDGYVRPASNALAYYTVIHGSLRVTTGLRTAVLGRGQSVVIPRGTQTRFDAVANEADVAVTELVPGTYARKRSKE